MLLVKCVSLFCFIFFLFGAEIKHTMLCCCLSTIITTS